MKVVLVDLVGDLQYYSHPNCAIADVLGPHGVEHFIPDAQSHTKQRPLCFPRTNHWLPAIFVRILSRDEASALRDSRAQSLGKVSDIVEELCNEKAP